MPRLIVAILTTLLLLSGLAVLVLLVQRQVLFPRPPGSGRPVPGVEVVPLTVGSAYFLPSAALLGRPAPLIVFTHGNGETAEVWIDQFGEARRHGWAVLLVEYPGYGGAPGSPSERSIVAATVAAFDWAAADPRVDPRRIVVWGRSLGTGPATRVAAERPAAGLILESGFTSVRPLAARFLVPGFLVRDPFDNLAALRHYRGPLLVFHGTADEVIPASHGEALARAVPGAVYLPLPCGHNDCPRPWPRLVEWLDRLVPSG